MLLYSAAAEDNDTITNVAFKFRSQQEFATALNRTIEGHVRGYVAGKKQEEILGIRSDIVEYVKSEIDSKLLKWGYHLIDLQLNEITFDKVIMESMAKVVAADNQKKAAENEGQALLITKTKAAEAEGKAIKISAEAEKVAAKMRGEGIALFREELAKGMSEAAKEMQQVGLDVNVVMFGMWLDALKDFAEKGSGNVIYLDGSTEGMQKTLQQLHSMSILDSKKS